MRRGAAGGADLVNLPAWLHKSIATAGFRQAVGVDISTVRKILLKFEDSPFRRFLPPANAPFETANIVIFLVRKLQYTREHDRCQPGSSELFSLNCRKYGKRFVFPVDFQHTTKPEHSHTRQVEGTDMIKWTRYQQTGLLAQTENNYMLHAFPVEIVIAMHDTFWSVRRPRRVHEAEKIIGSEVTWFRNSILHAREIKDILLHRIGQNMLWNINLENVIKFRISDQERCICVANYVSNLICRQTVVDREENSPKIAGSAGNFDKGWAVFHKNSDDISFADTLL